MSRRILTQRRIDSITLSVTKSRRKLKQQAVEYKGGKCEKCGYSKCPSAFDFHHPDPNKKDFGISASGYRSFERIKSELDKTMLLCSNCHREVHAAINLENLLRKEQELVSSSQRKSVSPRVTITCLVCSEEFKVSVSRLEKGTNLFCSAKCYGEWGRKIKWPSDEILKTMIWDRPAVVVAKELGLSSTAIKKRCKQRNIPTPPRGYWAKKKAGTL